MLTRGKTGQLLVFSSVTDSKEHSEELSRRPETVDFEATLPQETARRVHVFSRLVNGPFHHKNTQKYLGNFFSRSQNTMSVVAEYVSMAAMYFFIRSVAHCKDVTCFSKLNPHIGYPC